MIRAVLVVTILTAAMAASGDDVVRVTDASIPTRGPYVPATRFGDLVFTSGQIAFDISSGEILGDDIETQTRVALQNLVAVLEAAGSSPRRVLRITVYLENPGDFQRMNAVYAEFFSNDLPARTTVTGMDLPGSVLVEVDAIAAVSEAPD